MARETRGIEKADRVGGVVPTSQMPPDVAYIGYYADSNAFPNPGVANRLYYNKYNQTMYYWDQGYLPVARINNADQLANGTINKFYTAAVDATLVHKTGDETIAGAKNFTGSVTSAVYNLGTGARQVLAVNGNGDLVVNGTTNSNALYWAGNHIFRGLSIGGSVIIDTGSNVLATGSFYGISFYGKGQLTIGDGTQVSLAGAYGLFTSASENAGFTVNRDNQGKYASLDFLQGGANNSGWSLQMQPGSNDYHVANRYNGSSQMTFTVAGNTGINNRSPNEKLDVVGNVKATKLIATSMAAPLGTATGTNANFVGATVDGTLVNSSIGFDQYQQFTFPLAGAPGGIVYFGTFGQPGSNNYGFSIPGTVQLGINASTGLVSAAAFKGDGSQLTNLPATTVSAATKTKLGAVIAGSGISVAGDGTISNDALFLLGSGNTQQAAANSGVLLGTGNSISSSYETNDVILGGTGNQVYNYATNSIVLGGSANAISSNNSVIGASRNAYCNQAYTAIFGLNNSSQSSLPSTVGGTVVSNGFSFKYYKVNTSNRYSDENYSTLKLSTHGGLMVDGVSAAARYRGGYANTTIYAVNDLVLYNGNIYLVNTNHVSDTSGTPNASYFTVFVQRYTAGTGIAISNGVISAAAASSSATTITTIPTFTAAANGAQSITLPSSGTGVISLQVLSSDGSVDSVWLPYASVSGTTLTITADASIVAGDKISGTYY